jgi:hypothetical protein
MAENELGNLTIYVKYMGTSNCQNGIDYWNAQNYHG